MATPKIKIYRLFKGYSSTNDNDIQGATNDELLPIKQKKLMPAEAYELVGVNTIENDILIPVKRLGYNHSTGTESGYEYTVSDTSGKITLSSSIFTKYLVVNKETMFIEIWKKISETEYSSTYLKGILISEEDQNEPVDSSYDYKIFFDTTANNWVIWFTADGTSVQNTTYLIKNIWVYDLEEQSLNHTLIYGQDDTLTLDLSLLNGEKRQLFYDTSSPDFLNILVYDRTEDNQQGDLISPVYYTVIKDGRIIFNPQVVKNTRNIIIKYQLFSKNLSSPYLFTSLKCKLYNGTEDGTSLNNLYVERIKRVHNDINFTKNQDGNYEFSDSSKENLEMLCGGIIVNHKTKPWRTVSVTGKSSSSSSSSSSLGGDVDIDIVIDYYTDPTRGVFDLTAYINRAVENGEIDLNNIDYLKRGAFVSTYYYESSPTKTFVSDYQNWVTEHMRLNPDVFYGKKDYPGDEYIDSNNNTIQTPAIPCFVESGYTIRYRNGAVVFGEDKEDFNATSTEAESEKKGKVRANFTYYAGMESVINQKLDLDPNYVSGGFKYKALTDKEYPGSIGKRWVYRDDIQQFIGVSFLTKVKDPTTGKWTDVNLPDKNTIQSEKLSRVSFFVESTESSSSSSSSSSISGDKTYTLLPNQFLDTNYFKVENNNNNKLNIVLKTNDSLSTIGNISCSLDHDEYGLLNLSVIYPVIKIGEKINTSVEEQDGTFVDINTITIIDTMIESTLKIYNGDLLLIENTDYTISRVDSDNGLYEYIFRFNDSQIEKVNIFYDKTAILTREENYQNIVLTYYDSEQEQTIKFKLRAVDFFKDDSSYQCIVFSLNKVSNLSL